MSPDRAGIPDPRPFPKAGPAALGAPRESSSGAGTERGSEWARSQGIKVQIPQILHSALKSSFKMPPILYGSQDTTWFSSHTGHFFFLTSHVLLHSCEQMNFLLQVCFTFSQTFVGLLFGFVLGFRLFDIIN